MRSVNDQELRRVEGLAFFHRLKTAGLKDKALDLAKKHGPAAVGALGLTAAQYAMSRGYGKGDKSPQEAVTGAAVKATEKNKGSLRSDLAELSDAAAGVMKRHPFRTALVVAPLGAGMGRRVAKRLLGK